MPSTNAAVIWKTGCIISATQCRSAPATNFSLLPGQVLIPHDGRRHFPRRYLERVEEILCVGIHVGHTCFSSVFESGWDKHPCAVDGRWKNFRLCRTLKGRCCHYIAFTQRNFTACLSQSFSLGTEFACHCGYKSWNNLFWWSLCKMFDFSLHSTTNL